MTVQLPHDIFQEVINHLCDDRGSLHACFSEINDIFLLSLNGLHTLGHEFEQFRLRQTKLLDNLEPILFHFLSNPTTSTLQLNCRDYYNLHLCQPVLVYLGLSHICNVSNLTLQAELSHNSWDLH